MSMAMKSLTEQRRLLMLEYEYERRQFSDIAQRIGMLRLAEQGNAWLNVHIGKDYYNSLNQRVVQLTRDSADEMADHNFDYGRPVSFVVDATTSAPNSILLTGTIAYVDGDRMVVVVSDNAPLQRLRNIQGVNVLLSFDETSYRTMFDALAATASAEGRLAELRDLFYSQRDAAFRVMSPIAMPYLNVSQQQAVNKVLAAKDVAIVHGPPGTGKTTTLVEAINETLRRESQVLVCAQSNMAVDWICEKLVDRGIHVLRIGNPSRVNDKMLSFTYERRFADHPDYHELWNIRRQLRALRGRQLSDSQRNHVDKLRHRAQELEITIRRDVLDAAHVVASTLVGSSSHILDGRRFPSLFIDEAAQALEAACWIALRRADRVILAGDHCQLPPTVKCYEAQRSGLGVSMMERLAQTHPEAVTLLSVQYRMNEEIMNLSNGWFYKGAMTAAHDVRYRGILDYDSPVVWVDTSKIDSSAEGEDTLPDYREAIAGQSYGRINRDEAKLAVDTLADFLERIGTERVLDERIDVGLISPYRAQVQYLRRLIKTSSRLRPFRQLISVNTVDGFQGQERDVMVVSLVRSNDDGNIGFLRDLRRMNVAMTRARMKLIIIGSADTLTKHPFYKRIYESITSD